MEELQKRFYLKNFIKRRSTEVAKVLRKIYDNRYGLNSVFGQRRKYRKEILKYGTGNERLYGYDWGDPNESEAKTTGGTVLGNYLKIKEEYLLPFMTRTTTILELGSCGGGNGRSIC